MDIDVLEQYSELAVNSILAQDVTDYSSIVQPKTVLNVLYGATPQGGIDLDACVTVTGPVEFGRQTFKVLQWLQKSKSILQPNVSLEPRKPRKEVTSPPGGGSGASNSSGALAAATSKLSPSLVGGGAAAGPAATRQQRLAAPHRNANLSKMTIAYSNSKGVVTVIDECFLEDGKLAIVDRTVAVAPIDLGGADAASEASAAAAAAAHAAEVASFLGLTKSRIDTGNQKPPVLDFTFCDLDDLHDILRKKPTSGKQHVFRPVVEMKEGSKTAAMILPDFRKNNKALVKAKNKAGEEEIYEFDLDNHPGIAGLAAKGGKGGGGGGAGSNSPGEDGEDVLAQLASSLKFKYCCESVRLCNNGLSDLSQLLPVLRVCVANYFLTLHWIDLSSNNITKLCDLSSLPLTTLYLHGNRISDWSEVDQHVCNLPLLQSVTLHGNPIATSNELYKQEILRRLFAVPGRPIRQVDFVALSAQDLHVAGMYDVFHKGKGAVLKQAFEVSARGGSLSPRKEKSSVTGLEGGASTTPRKDGGSTMLKSSPRR
jgi:hypothetical protein